ncbi:MAG: DUF4404 family protein [Chloroflexi bacterium]|nr:DUF4404 family protein [Chloroflexota bacterium]
MASKKELQELLVELNKELRHTNSVSSRDDRVLRHLEKQIGQMVVAPEVDRSDLVDLLETAVPQLEPNHPTGYPDDPHTHRSEQHQILKPHPSHAARISNFSQLLHAFLALLIISGWQHKR